MDHHKGSHKIKHEQSIKTETEHTREHQSWTLTVRSNDVDIKAKWTSRLIDKKKMLIQYPVIHSIFIYHRPPNKGMIKPFFLG